MTSTDLKNFELGNILNRLFNNGFKSQDEFLTSAYNSWSVYLFPLVFAVLLIVLLLVLRLIIRVKRSAKEVSVLLEITPPAITEKSAYTTQELFKTIHGLVFKRTLLDKVVGKNRATSFEIVSTQNQGIRYLIRTTPGQVNTLKRNIYSYLPQGGIKVVDEYIPTDYESLERFHSKIVEFKLAKPFGLPLERQDVLKEHDPVAYITGQMTKLAPGELISLQIILSPTKSREVKVIEGHIKQGDVLEYLNKTEYPLFIRALGGIFKVAINICKELIGGVLSVFQEAGADPESLRRMRSYEIQSKLRMNESKLQREYTPYELELIQSIQEKIKQPLFDSVIRLLVIGKDKYEVEARISSMTSSFEPFVSSTYQELRINRGLFNFI